MTGLHVDYSEAYGDLNELLRSSTYAADEEQVPPTVVEYGRMVLRKTEGILPPPEVVGRPGFGTSGRRLPRTNGSAPRTWRGPRCSTSSRLSTG